MAILPFSEVKAQMDAVALALNTQRAALKKGQAGALSSSGILAAIPTQYADLIETVNAMGTSNAAEANTKAEYAKLAAEFTALKSGADAIVAVNLG
jgi:hypothetical protein